MPAVLEMTDYAPLPLREPVRSLVWIRGRIQAVPSAEIPELLDLIAAADPNPALLQINTADDADGDTQADLGAAGSGVRRRRRLHRCGGRRRRLLAAGRPDPFCVMESCWLQHLEVAHRDVIDRLADRLPTTLRRGRVRPLGLDRYGVRLRVENDEGDHDVRLAFNKPVDDVTGLSQAIRILMGCPFLNGLRARRPLP